MTTPAPEVAPAASDTGSALTHYACTTMFGDPALPINRACCGTYDDSPLEDGDNVDCPMCALIEELDLPCVHHPA